MNFSYFFSKCSISHTLYIYKVFIFLKNVYERIIYIYTYTHTPQCLVHIFAFSIWIELFAGFASQKKHFIRRKMSNCDEKK